MSISLENNVIEHRPGNPEDCLSGGGEMGALMRAFDWASSPIGPVAQWPQSLRTAVGILLETRFPMYIGWGPQFIEFYNDGYRPILGSTKHPRALGQPAEKTFAESWHIIGPMFEEVMRGVAVGSEDWMLPLDRNGYLEECFFTFSYSPIRTETGSVGGVLVTVTETTGRVLGERRLRTLRDLAWVASQSQVDKEAWSGACQVLQKNPADIPFALLLRVEDEEEGRICLEATTCSAEHAPTLAALSNLGATLEGSSAASLEGNRDFRLLTKLQEQFGTIITPQWPEPVQTAAILPIGRSGRRSPYGFLVAGISPRRALDNAYKDFLNLVADQVSTAIANARAH